MDMKKTLIALFAALMLPVATFADKYTGLWKEYNEAVKKDLPKSQINVLERIAASATKEKSYGNLLKAETRRINTLASISADSIPGAIRMFEAQAANAENSDKALAAVYYCVLADVYEKVEWKSSTFPNAGQTAKDYARKALAHPEVLAAKNAGGYVPFVKEGTDSRIFNNDLLSVVGYTLKEYRLLNDYYNKTGNRTAALVTALDMVESENGKTYRYGIADKAKGNRYIARLDSIINIYADLPECGEAALKKYDCLNNCADVTPAQKADFINAATKRWAAWRNIPRLNSEYERLIQPYFDARMKETTLPERADTMEVTVRNLKNIKTTITRLNLSGNTDLIANTEKDWAKIRKLMIASSAITVNTPVALKHKYDKKCFYVAMPKLKPGLYVVEVSADDNALATQRNMLAVSDIYMASIKLPERKQRIVVVSATTGQPIPEAKVQLTYSDRTKATVTTDKNGEVIVAPRNSDLQLMRAYTTKDNFMQNTDAWTYFNYYGNNQKYSRTTLFTDRAIYRPGQTVHVSAVAYNIDGLHSTKVASGKELTITLRNANNKVVAEKTVTTDDYGTASADFTLPEGSVMNGRFDIRSRGNGSGYQSFLVEEYKRPTFEVTIDKVDKEYHNGDTVIVSGKAMTYAGVPVQGARVAYSVKRNKARWFWRYSDNEDTDKTMLTDTIATDAEGKFELRIPVIMPEGYEEKNDNGMDRERFVWQRYYTFTASAQVTDNAGESHDATTSLTLGTMPTTLTFDMPDKALKDSMLCVTFKRLNASAKEIKGDVKYWFDNNPNNVYTAKANEKTSINWSKMQGLESGKHRLWAVCGNDTISRQFVLFSINDTKPAENTPDWAYLSSTAFPKDGKPVYVQVGSSCEDTHIFYTVIAAKKVVESGAYDVSNGIVTIPYSYKEEYGEGLLLNYVWVKDGVTYSHKFSIARPMQDKSLNMKWTTFRDKLTPGQKETWTLNISRPENTDVINKNYIDNEEKGCQLLAMMYDKSLDQIAKSNFSFSLSLSQNLPSTEWKTMTQRTVSQAASKDIKWFWTKPLAFSHFDYSLEELTRARWTVGAIFDESRPVSIRGYGTVLKAKEEVVRSESAAANEDRGYALEIRKDSEVKRETEAEMAANGNETQEETENGNAALQIRENMQETAFFYPALYADKDGNVKISFTLPESVTTWNFRGFAHDRNMNYGMIEGECVASKKIMVMPNMPRFVRNGDKATIATRVANTTDKEISTTLTLQMVDPATDKVLFSKQQKISIAANSTASATFEYSPDGKNELLVCRISADGKDYSDGEQHYLPVLPDADRVTNTVPFTFLDKAEKNILMDSIFPKDATNKKLTVEYTANPTWLMIQALPYVAQHSDRNAISMASAYYANVLGKYIMNQSPVIKKVVELWKKENKNEEGSLLSALEKNQKLKTLVLEETPWVMDADRETDQKRMLCTFFNESAIDYSISSLLTNMKKLQNSDGSWSWWEGMRGSASITAQVVETLARLKSMTKDNNADKMIDKAMAYLGNIVVKEYEDMMKAEKAGRKVCIYDSHAIQYLYINALLNRKLTGREKPAKDYLLDYLRKDRQRNIYAKALMAVILNKDGKTSEAKEYVESIKQYSVAKTDMGRYFDTRHADYSWFDFRIPTQTAAIEAIKAVCPDDKQTVDEMRLWLLQSKRTQAWDTPINSVNAVYAFIDGNYEVLSNGNNGGMTIALDGKNKTLPKVSAGLGYSKVVYDIDKQKTLTISKTDSNTSWGAAYAQFSQKAENITDNGSGIKVKREIISDKRQDALTCGDKIKVRITISADRDYDFVQVVDKRAACMEPVKQISGYHWGYYCVPKDNATNYYFDSMAKGEHVVETEYYVDRSGNYTTGTCTVQCAYSPEFTGRTGAKTLNIK